MANLTLSFNLASNPEVKADFEKAKTKACESTGLRLSNAQTLAKVLAYYLDEQLTDEAPLTNGNSSPETGYKSPYG